MIGSFRLWRLQGFESHASLNDMKQFLLRFIRIYFVLNIFPFPLDRFPKGDDLHDGYLYLWMKLFSLFNDRFLHWTISMEHSGSGDRGYRYFMVFTFIPIALLLAAVWKNADRCSKWFDIYLQWFLASTLLEYGFSKLFINQFPAPGITKLVEPYGQSSPMGLLWFFMGFSKAYSFFGGLAEVTAGVLLLIPRTMTLGALISVGVMSNVFMLNMCYDVPVKLFSFQLLVYSLWVAAFDGKRLLNFFVLHGPVPERRRIGLKQWEWRAWSALAALLVVSHVYTTYGYIAMWDDYIGHTPHRGIWRFDGPAREPKTDWELTIIEIKGLIAFKSYDGRFIRFRIDPEKLKIEQPTDDTLTIDGEVEGKPIHKTARKETIGEFPILTRGFHWMQEETFNR